MKFCCIDEIILGIIKMVINELFVCLYLCYCYVSYFWEDMFNDVCLYGDYGDFGGVFDNIVVKGLYIFDLNDWCYGVIGDGFDVVGGLFYVIVEVDGGQIKYWEWSIEGEY